MPPSKPALISGLFVALMRLATVFGRLLGITRLLASHIARIEVILAARVFARLLHIRAFVVLFGHEASLQQENNTQQGQRSLSS
jgi:hypothetical protein